MRKNETLSDDIIIAAILSTGSAAGAASMLNIDKGLILDRLNEQGFVLRLRQAQRDVLRSVENGLANSMLNAVNALNGILTDKESSAGCKLGAAQSVLKYAIAVQETVQAGENENLRCAPQPLSVFEQPVWRVK